MRGIAMFRSIVVILECAIIFTWLLTVVWLSLRRDAQRHHWLAQAVFASRFSVFQFQAVFQHNDPRLMAVGGLLLLGKLPQISFALSGLDWTAMNMYSFVIFMFNVCMAFNFRQRVGIHTRLFEHSCLFANALSNTHLSFFDSFRLLATSQQERLVEVVVQHMPMPMYASYTIHASPRR
jgi:hypothetical protein